MENFELIHKFLDGDLDAAQEEQFFGELSSSDELRTELKEQMAIKQAISRDYKAFTPAATSTVAIFSKLGFAGGATAAGAGAAAVETAATQGAVATTAANVAAVAAKVGFLQSLRAFFTANSGHFVIGLTSAAAAAVAVFFLMRPDAGLTVNNKTNDFPKITSMEVPAKSVETKVETPKVIYKYKYIVVERPVSADAALNDAVNDNETAVSVPNNDEFAANNAVSNVEHSKFERTELREINVPLNAPIAVSQPLGFNRSTNPGNGEKSGLSVELRGTLSSKSDIKEDLSPKHAQTGNNFALGVFYELTDDIALGVDYRRETFFQKFDGIEYLTVPDNSKQGATRIEAMPTIYSQEANFETVSAAIQYKPGFLEIYNARPVLGLSLGANKAGAVGRFMVGASYAPTDYLDILLGYDYSLLRFSHQSAWFNAGKTGTHFGVAYKF